MKGSTVGIALGLAFVLGAAAATGAVILTGDAPHTAQRSAAPSIEAPSATTFPSVAPSVAAPAPTESTAAVACSKDDPEPPMGSQPYDLTGKYLDDGGGAYYIRQAGTCLYFLGQSPRDFNGPPGAGFTNVFIGGITAGLGSTLVVTGIWSDVPYGDVTGHGALGWSVRRSTTGFVFTTVVNPDGFGSTILTEQQPVTPGG